MILQEFKERAIILDYVWGCHGTFLASILNNLIYSNFEMEGRGPPNNFHTRKLIVGGRFDSPCYTHLDDMNLDITNFNGFCTSNLPIVIPLHYRHNILHGIEHYNRMAINVTTNSWYRHFVNIWFNKMIPRDALKARRADYFIANFYRILTLNNGFHPILDVILPPNIDNLSTHQFSREQVIASILNHILYLHNNIYDTDQVGCYETNQIYHYQIDFIKLYDFPSFLQIIDDIKMTFNLSFELNHNYLLAEWNLLMSKQYEIHMDEIVQGGDNSLLHPLETAYSIFLKGCSN